MRKALLFAALCIGVSPALAGGHRTIAEAQWNRYYEVADEPTDWHGESSPFDADGKLLPGFVRPILRDLGPLPHNTHDANARLRRYIETGKW